MNVYTEIPQLTRPTVVASGTFDGLHLGHQAVLRQAIAAASDRRAEMLVLTFAEHPKVVTHSGPVPPLLLTPEEKTKLLRLLGADHCVFLPFDERLSQMSPEDFIADVLHTRLKAQAVCIGYNYRFGHKAKGNSETLREHEATYHYQTYVQEPVELNGLEISSSRIRQHLQSGELTQANNLLGRPYCLSGRVIAGERVGSRILGIPTANIAVDERKLIPARGVYAIRSWVGGECLNGVLNIGFRPTFNGLTQTIEAHFLNFNGDLYGEELTIWLDHSIRAEMKFNSPADLRGQIYADIEMARSHFGDDRPLPPIWSNHGTLE